MIHLIRDHEVAKSDGMILKSAINQCINRYHFQTLEDFASQIGWSYNKLINRLENKSALKWDHRHIIMEKILEVDSDIYEWVNQRITGRKNYAMQFFEHGTQLALLILGVCSLWIISI